MSETVRRGHAVIMLKALVVLGLGLMLMLSVLLKAVKHIRHSSTRPIQPGIVPLLMVLGVHAVEGGFQQTNASVLA